MSIGISPVKMKQKKIEGRMLDPRLPPKTKDIMSERKMIAIINEAKSKYRAWRDRTIAKKARKKELQEEQLVWIRMYQHQQVKDEVRRVRTNYQGPYRSISQIREQTYV